MNGAVCVVDRSRWCAIAPCLLKAALSNTLRTQPNSQQLAHLSSSQPSTDRPSARPFHLPASHRVLKNSIVVSPLLPSPPPVRVPHPGFRRAIHHLDGHEVVLQATGITKPGDYHYIEGEGMPIQNQEPKRGNLFVFYSVAFPVELSEGQKQAVRDLLKDTPMPVPPAA